MCPGHHIEVTLSYSNGFKPAGYYKKLVEYGNSYINNPGLQLPCNAIGVHVILNGLCFIFNNLHDAKYAHDHILESTLFTAFIARNPGYRFTVSAPNHDYDINKTEIWSD